jgi:hypothetical protein
MELRVLQRGSCEPLKAGVHAAALGLFAIMGLYNAAAWVSRRQRHLVVNAIVYSTLTMWEQKHVARHLAECRKCHEGLAKAVAPGGAPPPRAEAAIPARFAA